jgi:hypothetical protein
MVARSRGIGAAVPPPPTLGIPGAACTTLGGQTASGQIIQAGLPGMWDSLGANCLPITGVPAGVSPAAAGSPNVFTLPNGIGITGGNIVFYGLLAAGLILLPGYWKLIPVAVGGYALFAFQGLA